MRVGLFIVFIFVISTAIKLRPGGEMTQKRRHRIPIAKATLRDTPPVDVICRGRSPGSRMTALVRLPEFDPVTNMDVR